MFWKFTDSGKFFIFYVYRVDLVEKSGEPGPKTLKCDRLLNHKRFGERFAIVKGLWDIYGRDRNDERKDGVV